MAARQHSSPQSLWLVIGVAFRLAHRLGIHRERNLQGMTVFAAEMNRRLWWQIYLLNRHYVNLCEDIDSSDPAHILVFDTNRPLNLNDADLHPEMTMMPPEREGVTEMLFCSIRYEIGSFFRDLNLTSESQNKVQAIKQLVDHLEEKYAKHCDGSIPLQRVSRCLVKTTAHRLTLRHCHSMRDASENLAVGDRCEAFDTALLLLQTQNSSCASSMLDRYRWHTKLFYCFEALFPVLHTLAFKDLSESTANEAWQQVCLAYEFNPELQFWDHDNKSFYTNYCRSLNSLALKAWDRRPLSDNCTPIFVQNMQLQDRQKRLFGQATVDGSNTNVQPPENQIQHLSNQLPSGHHTAPENLEIDEQSWEYWLNIFDNQEVLAI